MRYGFKSEAERIALRERATLSLAATDPLDPRDLARRRQIAIAELGEFRALIPEDVEHLLVTDGSCFSAATVIRDGRTMIVYNESHAPARSANSIAHELGHLILEHEPQSAFDAFGNRNFPAEHEEEATWLACCLLVPRDGIRPVMAQYGQDLARAAAHYGVSSQLMQWRINMTSWRPRRGL